MLIGTDQHAHDHVIGAIREPRDLTDAQFSAAFSVALDLVRGGAGFAEYTPDAQRRSREKVPDVSGAALGQCGGRLVDQAGDRHRLGGQ